MREIGSQEVYTLKNCLEELAEHHNKVSVNFKGCYPKQPFEETLIRFSVDVDAGNDVRPFLQIPFPRSMRLSGGRLGKTAICRFSC